jgi:hypothetical protein
MLSSITESWASVYANHAELRTAIAFLHIGGLVAAGGCAVAADRITLRVARQAPAIRLQALRALHGTHRAVVIGLVLVVASGVLMFGADVDALLYSKLFWLKMALMTLLIVNGRLLIGAEQRVEHGDDDGWRPLKYMAVASLVLWSLTTLVGAALPNFG